MLNQKQAQAVARALCASGASSEYDIKCGLVYALCTPDFSEWRLNYGKLFISGDRMWVAGPSHTWKEAAAIVRNANRMLADVVRDESITSLHVPAAHYRNTVPLTADMAAEVWGAINAAIPLDDKRKARFLQALTRETDTPVYVPTRNRRAALHISNETFGLFLRRGETDFRGPSYSTAQEALYNLFKRHCALHNL